jgi:hypothetical protein
MIMDPIRLLLYCADNIVEAFSHAIGCSISEEVLNAIPAALKSLEHREKLRHTTLSYLALPFLDPLPPLV